MIIGVTGYGATGASAYVDLIKEFDTVQSFRASFEFQLLQQPDGIVDLHYNLVKAGRRLSANSAIKRFRSNLKNPRAFYITKETRGAYKKLSESYIDRLTQVRWVGRSNYDPVDLRARVDRLAVRNFNHLINKVVSRINPNLSWPAAKERYFSHLSEEEFVTATSEYLDDILTACGFDTAKPILLEQLFNTKNPTEGAEYFGGDVRSIVVDRDPRDVYYLTNFFYSRLCRFMPNGGNVEDFVKYYRALHTEQKDDPRVLHVKYEDIIYRYEDTIRQMKSFLGGLEHTRKGECFKPEFSINNTMLYKKHTGHEEEYRYIERELAEYLYPFEEAKEHLTFTPVETKPFDRQSEVRSRK